MIKAAGFAYAYVHALLNNISEMSFFRSMILKLVKHGSNTVEL